MSKHEAGMIDITECVAPVLNKINTARPKINNVPMMIHEVKAVRLRIRARTWSNATGLLSVRPEVQVPAFSLHRVRGAVGHNRHS